MAGDYPYNNFINNHYGTYYGKDSHFILNYTVSSSTGASVNCTVDSISIDGDTFTTNIPNDPNTTGIQQEFGWVFDEEKNVKKFRPRITFNK